jgi:ATP-dependent Clp protease ATP-binding subunit ClpC
MYERFTDKARRVIARAQDEARRLGHDHIGPEHILLGLVSEGGAGATVLEALGIPTDAVRERVEQATGPGQAQAAEHLPFTLQAKAALQQSRAAALNLGNAHIGTEHLLLGLIREGKSPAAQVLTSLGADLEPVHEKTVTLFAK